MADVGESSFPKPSPTDDKPVIVRVKRKAFQSRLDAFWLEINERPVKRPLLDFNKLSLSDSSSAAIGGQSEELKTKKVLVQHVETISSSEATIDIVQSFVSNSSDVLASKTKIDERRNTFKKENKQDQLLSKARHKQEVLAKSARFEQIWRSRKGDEERMLDKSLQEMCRFYDVVRVEVEEKSNDMQQEEDMSLEDQRLLCSYLPLLRDLIPNAAAEIESDISSYISKQASKDDYVYDVYTVKDDTNMSDEDSSNPFPLVQVDDDENFYDGPDDSEYESDDSNAENNPLNDYPDEISDEEDKVEKESSDDESEDDETDEIESNKSSEPGDIEDGDTVFVDEEMDDDYDSYDDADCRHDFDFSDVQEWREAHRITKTNQHKDDTIIQGVGGILELAPGYLPAVYSSVRKAGGICIADEVQSGFARTGSHFWGFEAHGVVPDIVTMAKGIGNGIPIGAVVTTPEIAKVLTYRNYFNTFGGNPVCSAGGLAVLKVIEKEKLQDNAFVVGSYLKERLSLLKEKHEIIGDVRGRGLMLGVELVTDRQLKTPAKGEILHIMDQMKDMGVLVGKGGFHGNVFRITPPLCFTKEDADFLVDVMDYTMSKM